ADSPARVGAEGLRRRPLAGEEVVLAAALQPGRGPLGALAAQRRALGGAAGQLNAKQALHLVAGELLDRPGEATRLGRRQRIRRHAGRLEAAVLVVLEGEDRALVEHGAA